MLYEELVQPIAKERLQSQQMVAVSENQFFHLTFSQYILLNRRPEHKFPDLIKLIHNHETFSDLKAELSRLPVTQEEDVILLAGLKDRMEAIEQMRNCVAHNREPSRKVKENYENARPLVDAMLDSYLKQLQVK